MGRPKKYQELDLYAPQRAYFKTEKGKQAIQRYENSEARKINKREWYRKRNGTIVDKRQWFIDTYGDIQTALNLLDDREKTTIELYYGLSGEKPISLRAIAPILKRSESLIGKIRKSALAKLEPLKNKVAENKKQLVSSK